jgi:Rha family phage regulatory protein
MTINKIVISEPKGLNTKTLTSMEVAEMVDKRHDHLMRDIRQYCEYLVSSKMGTQNFFVESTYQSEQNKTMPCYYLTKKGCELVANKLTGVKGVVFTAMYVEKFNEMENAFKLPQTYIEALESLIATEKEKVLLIEQKAEAERKYAILAHTKRNYTVTEIAKELGMKSAQELNEYLRVKGVQYQSNGTWVLYSKYAERAYFDIKQEVFESGKVIYHRKVTQTGREFILNLVEMQRKSETTDREDYLQGKN